MVALSCIVLRSVVKELDLGMIHQIQQLIRTYKIAYLIQV